MICDPIDELREACKAAGGQSAWAKANGVSPQYVSDVLRGKPPGDAILSALGIERVYRRVLTEEELPPNFAACCASPDISACDCVNKQHIRVLFAR